jgi:molecular chaperone GrpE (heat shock protein)
MNIWSQVTKLSQEFIEGFTMTSGQMQTRLKKYQLKVGNITDEISINI